MSRAQASARGRPRHRARILPALLLRRLRAGRGGGTHDAIARRQRLVPSYFRAARGGAAAPGDGGHRGGALMIGCYDFCGHYDWTFDWLERVGGPELVRDYWSEAISRDSQRHARELIEAEGF